MLSGFLAFKPDFATRGRVKKRFISLIIPYVIFSVLTVIWHIIICVGLHNPFVSDRYEGWEIVKRDIFCAFSGLGIGTLWFLPILFITFVILYICIHQLRNMRKEISFVILFISGMLLIAISKLVFSIYVDPSSLILKILDEYRIALYRICYGTGYTFLGYTFHGVFNYFMNEERKRLWVGVIWIILFFSDIIIYFVTPKSFMFDLVTCVIVLLSFLVLFEIKAKDCLKYLLYPLIWCGKNSLAITIYHYLFLLPVESMWFSGWSLFIINSISTILLIYILGQFRWHKIVMGAV